MDKLIVKGGAQLKGEVKVSSAKNASLPIMAACILNPNTVNLKNLPGLSDISFFKKILESLGATIESNKIDCSSINNFKADYELVRKMRASVLVLGPLLSRFSEAIVSLPGGCAIGTRPVDIHLDGLKALGADIEIKNGYIHAHTKGLVGCNINLAFASVGATENLIMAAVYAKGKTVIRNYAKEPEVIDLINFLTASGAIIEYDEDKVSINGVELNSLDAVEYSIIGDRIEAATLIIAALITKGHVKVSGFNPKHIESVLEVLKKTGAKFSCGVDYVEVFKSHELTAVNFKTDVHPGFPTDVQAQMMTLLASLKEPSQIHETIFENRFMHVPELNRLGFNIDVEGHFANVTEPNEILAAPVMCTDLRASAALVLGAMIAKGDTEVARVYHLDRGYESLETKLSSIGANIRRVKG